MMCACAGGGRQAEAANCRSRARSDRRIVCPPCAGPPAQQGGSRGGGRGPRRPARPASPVRSRKRPSRRFGSRQRRWLAARDRASPAPLPGLGKSNQDAAHDAPGAASAAAGRLAARCHMAGAFSGMCSSGPTCGGVGGGRGRKGRWSTIRVPGLSA